MARGMLITIRPEFLRVAPAHIRAVRISPSRPSAHSRLPTDGALKKQPLEKDWRSICEHWVLQWLLVVVTGCCNCCCCCCLLLLLLVAAAVTGCCQCSRSQRRCVKQSRPLPGASLASGPAPNPHMIMEAPAFIARYVCFNAAASLPS